MEPNSIVEEMEKKLLKVMRSDLGIEPASPAEQGLVEKKLLT